jgi:hypothetical protein
MKKLHMMPPYFFCLYFIIFSPDMQQSLKEFTAYNKKETQTTAKGGRLC